MRKNVVLLQGTEKQTMQRTAVFPGSFDPITRGHENVIIRSIPLFERIVIGVGDNSEKRSMFPIEQRLAWIKEAFKDHPTVTAEVYRGLTVDFCRRVDSGFIIRGLRTAADFEFERSIGQVNRKLLPGIETIFILSLPEYTALNSSIVRDIIRHGGDPSSFIPKSLNGLITSKEATGEK